MYFSLAIARSLGKILTVCSFMLIWYMHSFSIQGSQPRAILGGVNSCCLRSANTLRMQKCSRVEKGNAGMRKYKAGMED